jgi:hypothetical protein
VVMDGSLSNPPAINGFGRRTEEAGKPGPTPWLAL